MNFRALLTAVALVVATPTLAADNSNFTGLRADATVGVNSFTKVPTRTDLAYGFTAGLDIPLGSKFTLGAELNTSDVFASTRTYGAAGRLGYAFGPHLLGYVKGGYANYKDVTSKKLDGAVVGAGLEYAISSHTYLKGEYRYSDFSQHVGSNAAVLGVGLRF